MIWKPTIGQQVEIRHAAKKRPFVRYHGMRGYIQAVSFGPGPKNVLVQVHVDPLRAIKPVVIPRGNLVRI